MKIFLDMVGCRLNQSELESIGNQFRALGHTLVSTATSAELAVINTCTVTAAAASDSRQKVRQAVRAGANQVIVTGCHATLHPQQIRDLQGTIRVIGNPDKDKLVSIILGLPDSSLSHTLVLREPIPGARLRTRAFIKAQDGCDNQCTYCITRLARGPGRSRPTEDILLDIQSALAGGCQEIVLTGVHLGSWGHDVEPPAHLSDLVKAILDDTATPRLHLSSIEPWDITPEFLNVWQDVRLCRHLHLPLQSGCAATLKRMGRKITPDAYANLVHLARQSIPGLSITTDIITGFPGETEHEFSESMAFVERMKFSAGHVFTFSSRPGTSAVKLPGQINPAIGKHRNSVMRQIFQQTASAYRLGHIGQDLSVLWEKATSINDHQWQLNGLSDNYLRVTAISATPCRNQIMTVHITSAKGDELLGEILPIQSQIWSN
jgi:threonylcarbamoyladenosine tRNA methylthiotransferase MtaB